MLFQTTKTKVTKKNPVTRQVASTATQNTRSQDRATYLRFIAEYTAALKPEGMIEIDLSQRLARDCWRINRALIIEENALDHPEILTYIRFYRKTLKGNFRINLKLLRGLQSRRHAA